MFGTMIDNNINIILIIINIIIISPTTFNTNSSSSSIFILGVNLVHIIAIIQILFYFCDNDKHFYSLYSSTYRVSSMVSNSVCDMSDTYLLTSRC